MQGYPVSVQSPRQESAVIKYVMNDAYCRGDITINNSSGGSDLVLETGTVMGCQLFGTPTGAAGGGNTGNATIGSIALPAGTPKTVIGGYLITCITAGASAVWQVQRPDGTVVGQAKNGAAFTSSDIDFTITAGGTNSAVGDTFTVTVPAGAGATAGGQDAVPVPGSYVQVNATATDGSAIAAGVLYARAVIAANTSDDGAAVTRGPALVLPDTLIWPSGANAAQIATWLDQLAAVEIHAIPRV